jgi:hypothetical protein
VEICNDSLDNDNSGEIDCDDPKCADLAICTSPVVDEHCNNGIDDNHDGYIDCADNQCESRAECLVEICNNDQDDDADGRVDCEDRACRNRPACGKHFRRHSLGFSASASGEKKNFEATLTNDKDLSTRWWIDDDSKQWLKLDLGGTYPIDRVKIRWHKQYAKQYKIRVSKDGRYWRTVKSIRNSNGGRDKNTFKSRKARYILIECTQAAKTGYSIYEVKVIRSTERNDGDNG